VTLTTTLTDTPAPTRQLAAWGASARLDDVPRAVSAHAALCLLDGIGCALYGARQDWGRIAAQTAQELAPGGRASLWGRAVRVGPAAAAMANGTALHGFELDDIHLRSSLHAGAVVLPSVLALAETRGLSGARVLAAIVVGYEIGVRVGMAAGISHGVSGFHVTGTVGCIAAAAACAHLLTLDTERFANALGIGATQASGLYCARTGAMTKRFHAGHAAQAGVTAALLAECGFTGRHDVLEADYGGFMSAMQGEANYALMLEGLGQAWETATVGFKAYAACASAHTIIDGVRQLMEQGASPATVLHLRIRVSRKSAHNVGWRYQPADVVAAQMNGSYAAAVQLLDGQVFVDQYAPERLADQRILALIDRIEVVHDPELDAGGAAKRHASWVEADLTDGRVVRAYTEQRRGSAHHPLPPDEIIAKFRGLAAKALRADAIETLQHLILTIEDQPDLTALTQCLRAAA
jgi:aconitate decarboxylase